MRERLVVHLVDDDNAVRQAIAGLLTVCGYEVRQYPGGRDLLQHAETIEPGCILLDLRMPDMSGLEVQAELAARQVDCPVIYLTAHGDVQSGVLSMKRGAVDFLEKPVQETALLTALQQGFHQLSARAGERAANRLAKSRAETLTPREREVIDLVVQGNRNREIARLLDISLQTVKVHRMRGMAKMGVASIPELTRMWAASAAADSSQD